MLSGSGFTFSEVSKQFGVGRSTLYRHLHASGWEWEAVSKAIMRQALNDDTFHESLRRHPLLPRIQAGHLLLCWTSSSIWWCAPSPCSLHSRGPPLPEPLFRPLAGEPYRLREDPLADYRGRPQGKARYRGSPPQRHHSLWLGDRRFGGCSLSIARAASSNRRIGSGYAMWTQPEYASAFGNSKHLPGHRAPTQGTTQIRAEMHAKRCGITVC